MIHLKNILLVSFLLIGLNSFAQTDSIQFGKLEVKVIDAKTKKPIEFAVVKIEKDSFKKSKYADKNGIVYLDSLPVGTYNISTNLTGYMKVILEKIILNTNLITKRTIALDIKTLYPLIQYERIPLIKRDEPTQHNLNRQQIMRIPY